ncbi:MAG: molecular chaperone TorD family protein [Elusimicrobia bacterium]|nr:molecular chaperone TorD family protein [Elusimicrobiota bacterium]
MADKQEIIKRALAESCFYKFLSCAFLYPGELAFFSARDSLKQSQEAVAVLGCPEEIPELLRSLKSWFHRLSDSELESEYARVFGHTISKECPPYETQCGGAGAHIFQQTQVLGDISGFYRAFGLEPSELSKERLDHISIEMEFMALLACKEAYALDRKEEKKAGICVEAEKKFLSNHLGTWIPDFTARLSKKAGDGFYRDLALLTKVFVAFEARAKGAQPSESVQPAPLSFEPEGSCFACGVEDTSYPEEFPC